MRVKEILPWTVESPVIQLVQPRPAAPQGHALVLDRPVVPLPRKEQTDMLRPSKQGRHAAFKKKTSYLKCDYISPSIHQLSDNQKISNNFYDLRNSRLVSADVGPPSDKSCAAYTARSKSLDESSSLERRKTSPNFEEILRDLCCDLKKSDDRSERSERTSPSRISEETKCSSSDSVFYDVALDDVSAESSNETSRSDVNPRKSFSEDSFDRHRKYLAKQRNRLFEKATSKSRATSSDSCDECYDDIWKKLNPQERRRVSQMVDDLLLEIYRDNSARPVRRRSCIAMGMSRQGEATPEKRPSLASVEDNIYYTENTSGSDTFRYSSLQYKSISDLRETRRALQAEVRHLGGRLVKQLFRRDCLIARRDWHCDWITAYLQANSEKRSEDTKTRFSVTPSHGDSGFTQWQNGMRMVARLPEGIPPQFRRTLWLNLAEKHLASRGIQWQQVEEFCFNEFTNPDDEELGVQIVKDVHRTGCSLFCGVSGKDNQALLKRVLLAYARWNKAVGYCQGFNMLAALILQVMDRSEVDAVKVMIYLIEGVLPESYFANNLRGLSVDMAVFRDLLRIKLPTLSKHFDQLQIDSKDSGTSYEPPLTNVFTMQWFLTLFCNCLPQGTVLRVWDLIFLEGNHVLLATALAIWSTLADRILSVESADEFYCIMGVLTREMLEFGLMDANALIKAIVSFNLSELPELRERYLYNITPWTHSVSTVARRGLRLFYSDDDTDTEEDDDKIAIATAYGLFKSPKKKDGSNEVTSPPRALTCPDKEKIAMDISALTKQYRKLRERQKQAHVILTAACGSQSLVAPTSPAMNHLLMGKFALINNKGRRLGPPPGAIPPPSGSKSYPSVKPNTSSGETLHWKDTSTKRVSEKSGESEKTSVVSPVRDCSRRSSSSSSTSTELCDDPMRISDSEDQTNSLSECYAPPIVSGSSPLTLMQTKTHLPLDVENCRKEYTEPSITVQSTITNNLEPHKTDGQEGEMTILTPEGDDEKPQQKRKPSFKIDPEEMRQLDRKLSLKIVEIERRKSSAGIESEDLNSVLFSFDRDYIQDVEKTDRDSPASIPDDRLCSTDFVSGLEESVIIPDLITTHKPLNNRMTSLEECDETSDNEIDENLFDNDNQEDWEECGNNQGSLDNEECDENQSNLNVNEVNYDHLFARSSEYLNPTSTDNSELLELDNTYSSEQKDPDKQICQQEIDYSGKLISEPIISEQICFTSNQTKLHNTFEVDEIVQPKISTVDSPVTEESVDVSINLYSNPKLSKDSSSHCETSDSNPIKIDPKNIIQHPLNNSITNLDEKLASLLPLISTSINSDSIPPNFTSISSTDGCIKSIKKKYENFPQTSIDIKDSEAVRDETNKFLSKLENCYKINDSNVISNDINSILTKDSTLIITPIKEPHDENIEENCIIGIYNNDRTNSYDLNTGIQENTSTLNVSENSINLLKEEPKDTYSFRRENISPYHSKPDIDQTDILIQKESPKRRGSEVALSLILKENLQILSKIQQQSRRSSEICINSKNSQDPIITGSTESLIVINETAILQSKTDIDNLSKLTEITDISENKNEEGNYFRWSLKNSPDTSKSSYESKDSQIVSSSKTVVDTNFNQPFNEQNENGTEVKTSCKEEGHNHSLISEKINSFDRLCKLPDLCKLDEKIIHSSRPTQYEYSSESSTNLEGNTLQTSHVTKKDIEEFVETDTTKPYKEEKGMLLHSTKEKEEFINFSQSVFNESESFNKMSCFNKPNTQEHCLYSSNRSSLYNIVDDTKDIEIESINFPESEISNANKDILEELRSLDIEPDEVFDYFDSKVTENTTHMSKKINTSQELEEMPDSFNTSGNTLSYLTKSHHETLVRSSNTAFKYSCNERSLGLSSSSKTYTSNLFPKKQMSFDYSSDFNSDCNRSKYSAQKSYSLDTIYHDKILSKKYLNDPDSEHVNKLYSDGYDYHKQLTEKSTSNESKSKNDYHTEFETKDSQNLDDSVYSLTRNKSPIENTYYSVRQSRFSEHREFSNRERILFKYKSEDFGSSSPTHYRFSSASPIRKGLTSPSPDSSIVSSYITDRAKSSSPISATTFNKKTVPDTHTDRTALDYEYGGCRGVKKHFRTESLDLKLKKDDFSQISKKKSELLETFSSDTVLKEKKSPSSPLKFNPFPVRSYSRQPRDLGVKLGLYLPSKPDKSPTKT